MPLNGSMVLTENDFVKEVSHNLPLNSKLSAKFHTFSATGGSTEMLKNG